MLVICLEGCHGCGKSSLCSNLCSLGFQILDEGFMNMPETCLHPQTLTMEFAWVSNWFLRLLEIKKSSPENAIYFADRSPYSAEFYAPNGKLLKPVIDMQIAELKEKCNINIVTVNLKCDRNTLWERISHRVIKEPHRKQYNEHLRSWMETTCDFYDSHEWDIVLNNTNTSVDKTANDLTDEVCDQYAFYKRNIINTKYNIRTIVPVSVISQL
eukprot:TRINITY_DN3052_c0_g1_i1.p1 TRINITY_DN3052_c0_g1~~TRINITY_DN3052_c0_g1_i1.p1  ORF type:complete len:213 (-),score=44.64 TRINITY_DN3052_c0_g1_i1:53-691(-)